DPVVVDEVPESAFRRRRGQETETGEIGHLRHRVVPGRALVHEQDALPAVRIERGLEAAHLARGEDARVQDPGDDRIRRGGRGALRWHLPAARGRLSRDRAWSHPVDAAGRVVAYRAEEPPVELRLDAVERVAAQEGAARGPATTLEQDQAPELRIARV